MAQKLSTSTYTMKPSKKRRLVEDEIDNITFNIDKIYAISEQQFTVTSSNLE